MALSGWLLVVVVVVVVKVIVRWKAVL